MKTLTRKELAARWGNCSHKTIRRAELKHGLAAVNFVGNQPVYTLAAVEACEKRRLEHMKENLGKAAAPAPAATKVITVKEAKRRAGKRGVR